VTPHDILCDLSACLCRELTPKGGSGPNLCFCGVIGGDQIPASFAFSCPQKCGVAYVRLTNAYPSVGLGVRPEQPQACGVMLTLNIEMAVLRCYEVPANGEEIDAASLEATACVMSDDLLAMRRAVACCASLSDLDYGLLDWTPQGPQGGLIGGGWTLQVLL
jgi:hypothetical protein